jgi:copper(I)-binding protein
VGALTDTGRRHIPRVALVACLAVLALAACASGDDTTARPISVSDAWALATVTGQPNGAVYFTVMSTAGDTLERVTVSDSIADHAEMHESTTTATGAIGMQEMKSGVPLEPGTAVTFTPGGKHVMLVDLVQPLAADQTFDITLEFASADPITLPVAVVESAP